MANQQLKDYIAQQTKIGASKDVIKSALLGAGWKESDVTDAFSEIGTEPAVQTAPVSKPAQLSGLAAAPDFSKPASSPVSSPISSEPASKLSPISFVTSDIFRPKEEQVFKPAGMDAKPNIPDIKPQIMPNVSDAKPQFISMNQVKSAGSGGKLLPVLLGVISVALLGGNVYFFLQSASLGSELNDMKSGNTSFESSIAALTSEKNSLTAQVESLNKTIADLNGQISIFAVPQSGPTSSVPFDVSGVLGGGGKALYSLTTSKNVTLFVKNSKETAVDAALKSSVGKQVQLGGTHQAESNYLTVTTLNGQPVEAALQSTSTGSTAPVSQTTTSIPASGIGPSMPPAPTSTTPSIPPPAVPAGTSTATSTP